jgi:hypothetical protein
MEKETKEALKKLVGWAMLDVLSTWCEADLVPQTKAIRSVYCETYTYPDINTDVRCFSSNPNIYEECKTMEAEILERVKLSVVSDEEAESISQLYALVKFARKYKLDLEMPGIVDDCASFINLWVMTSDNPEPIKM